MSSSFDTVVHDILLSVLERRFGVDGIALPWFQSCLVYRTQTFVINGSSSTIRHTNCSVPQGSVLGPLQFIAYTEDVSLVFKYHKIQQNIFANDKQA